MTMMKRYVVYTKPDNLFLTCFCVFSCLFFNHKNVLFLITHCWCNLCWAWLHGSNTCVVSM